MNFSETKDLLHYSNYFYVITVNMDGRYSYVNTHYDNVFSQLHGSILNKPYQITMHADDTKICEEVSKKCFANPHKVFPATIRKHDGQGDYIVTQWEYRAILDGQNNPAGIFCIGYDITQFVIQQTHLTDAKSAIQQKDLALKEIAFIQSHLVRMPLTNIMALSDIIANSNVDNDLKNVIQMLNESAKQLDTRIKQIVDTANN